MTNNKGDDYMELLIDSTVTRALAAHREMMFQHMDKSMEKMEARFREGFPGGDLTGHRTAHERMMKEAAERKTFREKLTFHITTWGLSAGIGWAILQFGRGIKEWLLR